MSRQAKGELTSEAFFWAVFAMLAGLISIATMAFVMLGKIHDQNKRFYSAIYPLLGRLAGDQASHQREEHWTTFHGVYPHNFN